MELSWYILLTPMFIVPIILLFAFLGCGARTGLREPQVERIAFEGHRGPTDARGTIYVVRTDVSAAIIDVTVAPRDHHGPSWSPNGMQMAFGGWDPLGGGPGGGPRAGIWVLNIGLGGNAVGRPRLIANALNSNLLIDYVAWGPDGSIAYADDNAIWTVPSTATPATRPTRRTLPGILAAHPTWAPDGRIAFTNTVSGNTFIFILDAAGGLTPLIPGSTGNEHEPHWNPNGTGIIFVRGNDVVYFDLGSRSERLVINDGRNPVFSRDSTRVAFVRGGRIWTCAANGSNPQPLTPGPHDNRPTWTRTP